jgi:hypothetical protein
MEEMFVIPRMAGIERDLLQDCGFFGRGRDCFGYGAFELGGGRGEGKFDGPIKATWAKGKLTVAVD